MSMTTNAGSLHQYLHGFTMREVTGELVRRLGPEEACRQIRGFGTVDALFEFADEYDRRVTR